jgi:predicted nucleotidyltransferase component of viral defense system
MSPKSERPRNMAASVRERLTQQARSRSANVQLVMTRCAIERLLYRLSLSRHRERFVLKGAMLFAVWANAPYRTTADLDLLGSGDPEPQLLARAIREVCSVVVEDDGVTFLAGTLRVEAAREVQEYQGARMTMTAVIAGARLAIHVDVGYGDAITPGVLELEFPSILDMPRATLRAYPPETVVAEKLHALVALGMVNSRMKDFYDLWAMAGSLAFDGAILAREVGVAEGRVRAWIAYMIMAGAPHVATATAVSTAAHYGSADSGRHDADARRPTRPGFRLDHDLDVLVERGEQGHQALDRESGQLIVPQRRDLGLSQSEQLSCRDLGQFALFDHLIERIGQAELRVAFRGVGIT